MFVGVDLNELGGHRAAASGHLALAALLRDEHVDGIGASCCDYASLDLFMYTRRDECVCNSVSIQVWPNIPQPDGPLGGHGYI